jgi:outer membrane protein assembly factor BamB
MSFARADDLVYVPGSMTGTVLAFARNDGTTAWHVPVWQGQRLPLNNGGIPGHEVYSDLAIAHGLVFVGCNDGVLRTFDASTGERGWTFETRSPIQSSPSVADGTVYFGCWNGFLYAINAVTGELRWKYKLSKLPAATGATGGQELSARIISSPWPGYDALFVGCDDGTLYALE